MMPKAVTVHSFPSEDSRCMIAAFWQGLPICASRELSTVNAQAVVDLARKESRGCPVRFWNSSTGYIPLEESILIKEGWAK